MKYVSSLRMKAIDINCSYLGLSPLQLMENAGAVIAQSVKEKLGSGLFRLRQARLANRPVLVGLGTDVGAGTSFSLLQTLSEAYKVVALEQSGTPERQLLSAFEGFYLATLGGARALYLDA